MINAGLVAGKDFRNPSSAVILVVQWRMHKSLPSPNNNDASKDRHEKLAERSGPHYLSYPGTIHDTSILI